MERIGQAKAGTGDAAAGPREARASTATIKDLWGPCPFNRSMEVQEKKAADPSAEILLELDFDFENTSLPWKLGKRFNTVRVCKCPDLRYQ